MLVTDCLLRLQLPTPHFPIVVEVLVRPVFIINNTFLFNMGNTESIIVDSKQMEGLRRGGEENDRDATLHGVKDAQQVAIQQVPSPSECPIPEKYRNRAVYNVYNQRIDPGSGAADRRGQGEVNQGSVYKADILDPTNNMPIEPNQQPCPGQKRPLSIRREKSTIPKGGTDTEWLYPSPQMFFNGAEKFGEIMVFIPLMLVLLYIP